MYYFLIFLFNLLLTLSFIPYLTRIVTHLGLLDHPDSRKVHTSDTPKMGGLAIYLFAIISLFVFTHDLTFVRALIISSGFIFFCGFFDDIWGLKWSTKFIFQIIGTISALFFLSPLIKNVYIFSILIPYPFNFLLLFFFILGIINAVNLLDGLDGLVSGFSLLIFMILFVLAYLSRNELVMVLTASLMGALFGFIKYNAYPAKIFLGDTGSQTLGFFIAIASIYTLIIKHQGHVRLTFAIILLGIPIIDTIKVMIIRMWNGHSPFLPDKRHIHHIIFGSDIRHKITVLIIQGYTILLIMVSAIYLNYSKAAGLILFVVSVLLILFTKQILNQVRKLYVIRSMLLKVFYNPKVTIHLYRKYIIPGSAILLTPVYILLFPGRTILKPDELILVLLLTISILLISIIFFVRNSGVNPIYVLINIIIFVTISSLSSPVISNLYNNPAGIFRIIEILTSLILGMVVIFLITRKELFFENLSVLDGIDLILLVFISLGFIIKNFLGASALSLIGVNLILGFIIYVWYKIIIKFYNEFENHLIYSTFLLPLSSLIILYFGG